MTPVVQPLPEPTVITLKLLLKNLCLNMRMYENNNRLDIRQGVLSMESIRYAGPNHLGCNNKLVLKGVGR